MDDFLDLAEKELLDAGAQLAIFAARLSTLLPADGPVEIKLTFHDEDGQEQSLTVDASKEMSLCTLDHMVIYLGEVYAGIQELKEDDEGWAEAA